MERKINLGDGYTATVWWDMVDDEWVVTAIDLRHGEVVLGVLLRDHRGDYQAPGYWDWYNSDEEQAAAAAYFLAKYPDLADVDQQVLFEEGFCREEGHLGDTIEKAEGLAKALNQDAPGPYVAVDREGRIVRHAETAQNLIIYDLEGRVREPWVSPDHADERTLMVAPLGKIRVQVA
jgi:PAS domain-containing protein